MKETYIYLNKYLRKIKINIDFKEYTYQFSSHPESPSLLAISDTLTFFNINNAAFRITKDQLTDLPDDFICQIKTSDGDTDLTYVRQKNNGFEVYHNDEFQAKTAQEFQAIFDGIVLLAEKSEQFIPTNSNNKFSLNNFLALSLFMVFCSFLGFKHYQYLVFYLTSCLGIFFSVQALKEVFGVESKVLAKVCNGSVNISCDSVLKSDKWALFKRISFSDLSLLFFAIQAVAILVFTGLHQTESFFNLQKIILAISIIPIATSVYYQKIVEKKWCPICLLIITTLLAQMVFIFLTQVALIITIDIYALIIYALIAISLITVWLPLKKNLMTQKQLQEDNFKLKRFSRNYELFKNTLTKSEKKDLPSDNPIVLGNKDSVLIISIATSPYCGHCKEVHEVIDRIIKKYDNVKVNLYLSIDISNRGAEEINLYRNLINTYLKQGGQKLSDSMLKIHQTKNYQLFKDAVLTSTDEIDKILITQNDFCKKADIHYTPAIYLNGYEYPSIYDRKELEFFITELIEDEI